MAFLILDTETNGLPIDQSFQYPLQISWIITGNNLNPIVGGNYYIYNSKVTYNENALNYCGITKTQLENKGVSLEFAITSLISSLDITTCIIGHNIEFDIATLITYSEEFKTAIQNVDRYCTMENGAKYLESIGHGNKWPKLMEIHSYTRSSFRKISFHDSFDDCKATLDVLRMLQENMFFNFTTSFELEEWIQFEFNHKKKFGNIRHICTNKCEVKSCPYKYHEILDVLNPFEVIFSGDSRLYTLDFYNPENDVNLNESYSVLLALDDESESMFESRELLKHKGVSDFRYNSAFFPRDAYQFYSCREDNIVFNINPVTKQKYDSFYFIKTKTESYTLITTVLANNSRISTSVNHLYINLLSNSEPSGIYKHHFLYPDGNYNFEINLYEQVLIASSEFNFQTNELINSFKYANVGIDFIDNKIIPMKSMDFEGVFELHSWI